MLAGGHGLGGRNLFDLQIERAFERKGGGEAGDDDGVGGQMQVETEDVNGAALGEGQTDLAHAPGQREQR